MKKTKLIYAMAAVALLATACQDNEVVNNGGEVTPAAVGDEILFGGRAGFENGDSKTRTEYSGVEYTYNGVKYERINWVAGDAVEIHSPEAANGPKAQYAISGVKAGDESAADGANNGEDYAFLTKMDENALQWGSDDVHTFYAMYPSARMFDDPDGTVAQGINMDGTTMNGIVPISQVPASVTVTDGHYVAHPDMKYAYMVAKSEATREKASVSLSFVPVVTVAEIQMVLPSTSTSPTGLVEPVTIQEIQVSGTGIAGAFTADLAAWNPTETSTPVCTNSNASDLIQLTTIYNNKAITIQPGGSLTFTVFLLPGADINDLRVSVSATGAGYVTKALQNVTVVAKKKNVFKNLKLPTNGVEIDASNWMSQIPDGVRLTQLSLPGTGGSFSYASNQNEYYQSQSLDFEAQWQLGIRAFEIITDRVQNDFANEPLRCNNEIVSDLTVSGVVNQILTHLDGATQEGAMVIFTYQPVPSFWYPRDPGAYMEKVMAYVNSLNHDDLALFQPGMTLGDVRGKLLIVVRPTQNDEDAESAWDNVMAAITGDNADRVLVINGCGTGKDKWGARGYTIDGVRALDLSNKAASNATNVMEEYMQQDEYLRPTATTTPVAKGAPQFSYATNNSNITCWFQEWARVVGQDVVYTGSNPDTYWFESYTEKLNNATETFSMAISGEYSGYVFINSLCGYLAGDDYDDSITPSTGNTYGGAGGNIKALADKINPDFYDYVLNCGLEQTTGPTGVVLMDYVSNDPNSATYALPGTIIANNFKHTIIGSGNTESGKGDGGSDEGDGI